MSVRISDVLYVATHSHIVALLKSDGSEIWRSNVTSMFITIIIVDPSANAIYASSEGKLYAVSATDGKLLWKNSLSGHGFFTAGIVIPDANPDQVNLDKSIPTLNMMQQSQPNTYQQIQNIPQQSLYPSLPEQIPVNVPHISNISDGIFCASNGLVSCVRKSDGADVWKKKSVR